MCLAQVSGAYGHNVTIAVVSVIVPGSCYLGGPQRAHLHVSWRVYSPPISALGWPETCLNQSNVVEVMFSQSLAETLRRSGSPSVLELAHTGLPKLMITLSGILRIY